MAVAIDGGLQTLEGILAGAGLIAAGGLATLRSEVNSPAYPEISPGSPVLTALAAAEPVRDVEYHTFGGTSTWFCRLRANIFAPESAFPLGQFHWTTATVPAGVLVPK
jgi:hypothetical protein